MSTTTTSTALRAVMNTTTGDSKTLSFKYVDPEATPANIRAFVATIVAGTQYLSLSYAGARSLAIVTTQTTTTDIETS